MERLIVHFLSFGLKSVARSVSGIGIRSHSGFFHALIVAIIGIALLERLMLFNSGTDRFPGFIDDFLIWRFECWFFDWWSLAWKNERSRPPFLCAQLDQTAITFCPIARWMLLNWDFNYVLLRIPTCFSEIHSNYHCSKNKIHISSFSR